MTLHRFDAKRDGNEKDIVDVLEARGYVVDRVSSAGFPDLVVSKGGAAWFVEVKRPKGTYTPAQVRWRLKWRGPAPYTLRSVEDALAFPTEIRSESAA